MEVINEGTTAFLTVAFKNPAGVTVAPSAISYRVDCLTTGGSLRAATSVSPAPTVEIELDEAIDNVILGSDAYERRRVTITANYGSGYQAIDYHDYLLKNLKFIT